MHNPYEIKLGHPPDFKVQYRFYGAEEGGRTTLPRQGYRSDFWYFHPDHKKSEIFMIWPEFEGPDGKVIIDENCSVPARGIAQMWIIVPERRPYHYNKIMPGLIGYFMEGQRKLAECTILEVIGLQTNPIK